MKIINLPLFQFHELGKESQNRAIDAHRYINIDDSFWCECILEDFCQIAETIGIETSQRDVYFGGFGIQSEGSCFDSKVDIVKLFDGIRSKAWLEIIPDFRLEFYKPDVDYRVIELIKSGVISFELNTTSGRNCVLIVNGVISGIFDEAKCHSRIQHQLQLLETWAQNALRTFNAWLFTSLFQQYEYLISEQAVAEFLVANDYWFTCDGELANHIKQFSLSLTKGI